MTSAADSYTQAFFATQGSSCEASAREVVPLLVDLLQPKRVVDVGCGTGMWTQIFTEHGVDATGVDGDYVDPTKLCIRSEKFLVRDLTEPLRLSDDFDLAVCLEVAEHLPPERAAGFIEDLARLAPVIAFSAAVPGQGGVRHLNEQWPDYWAVQFQRCGYLVVDSIRNRIWSNERILWYYRQNLFLFVRESALGSYPRLQVEMSQQGLRALSVVHPAMYLGLRFHSDPQNMPFAQAWRHFGAAFASAVRRKMGFHSKQSVPQARLALITPQSRTT